MPTFLVSIGLLHGKLRSKNLDAHSWQNLQQQTGPTAVGRVKGIYKALAGEII